MLHQPPPPTGPRASGRLASSRLPSRGGIQKRNTTPARVDKDGDLVMDQAGANVRASGRGRGAAIRGSARVRRTGISESLGARTSRPTRTGIDPSAIQKAVLRGMGSSETAPRGPRSSLRNIRGRGIIRPTDEAWDQITVKGFKQSKAATNPGGGISELIAFLERKATHPDAPETVKIKKSRLQGDALIISVRPEDTSKIERLNNFQFAGAALGIEVSRRKTSEPLASNADSETPNTIDVLKSVLSRRYNTDEKLLDLSQLGTDPELVNIGMFSTTSRESKFFPALMKICDSIFTTAHAKEEAVVSVSLANNALITIASVTTLSQTFPALKNLDLSNNKLKNLTALEGWRWKFRKLDQLILTGNPIEAEVPKYKDDVIKWYPTLTLLNSIQIRSLEDARAAVNGKLPIPILGPSFRDEAAISENFVKQFFPAYDGDRTALVNGYYDAQSTFSISINLSAPHTAETTNQKLPGWEAYLRKSRNLTKITHPPSRMSRLHTGTESIRDGFTTLPVTRHPDIMAEPQKWCVECHTIPGLPDPTGQSSSGVGGLMVMVHGEFTEVDVSTGHSTATRSFDRTFVLGPGGGVGGIRVACDTLVLRAYGGHDAWRPEVEDGAAIPRTQAQVQHQIDMPAGFALSGPGKTEEQVQKEVLAVELSKGTGMTLEFSGLCLEQSGWNLEGAAASFEQAKVCLHALDT
ncbi:MAG: nuclear mRNA export, poly(A)+RNA binding protein [Alectoria fallacina]|uniref:mRNA export factor MEX67 n=1 Tax=Alectoria fallacina TaxID=1903189 RepID=A0A8H3ERK6_9LECA|nr:MAG: nuclear mRNA export, poly(A)+RNA binding protein [Alectoria fallacina]